MFVELCDKVKIATGLEDQLIIHPYPWHSLCLWFWLISQLITVTWASYNSAYICRELNMKMLQLSLQYNRFPQMVNLRWMFKCFSMFYWMDCLALRNGFYYICIYICTCLDSVIYLSIALNHLIKSQLR